MQFQQLHPSANLMNKLPTNLKVLECIYSEYKKDFHKISRDDPEGISKIYVPIDVRHIAQKLGTDEYELFGRLYYQLDQKYRYKQDNGSLVHLFAFKVGKDPHCINYPYLAAVLSEYRTEDKRNRWALWISVGSLALAGASIIAQIVAA